MMSGTHVKPVWNEFQIVSGTIELQTNTITAGVKKYLIEENKGFVMHELISEFKMWTQAFVFHLKTSTHRIKNCSNLSVKMIV